jgi:hypothetical protein
MNRKTETLLLQEIAPRLRAAIPKTVPMIGPDDPEELIQDGLAIAAGLHRSAKRSGKKVTAGNIAHYTVLALRSGRRSTGFKTNDALHPAAQLSGHAQVYSLDAPISDGDHGEAPLTLHDCLAAEVEDPATTAARRLDWQSLIGSLDRTRKAVLVALAEGRELTLLVRKLRRSRSALQDDKRRLGRLIQDRLGADILIEIQSRPAWTSTIDAVRERLACRAERRAARRNQGKGRGSFSLRIGRRMAKAH